MEHSAHSTRYYSRFRPFFRSSLVLTVFTALLTLGIFYLFPTEFYRSYLVAWFFWISLVLGALFLTLLYHVGTAEWGAALRRITESISVTIPVMALLFLPVYSGITHLYYWSAADAEVADKLPADHLYFLSASFFSIRSLSYLIIWILLAFILYRIPLKQDLNDSPSRNGKFRTLGITGIILFVITFTLACFDWLMSVDPHGYPATFSLYIFTGTFLATLAFITVAGFFLRRRNFPGDAITSEHFQKLAERMLLFIILWGYLFFIQYLPTWYTHGMEETAFFRHRWEGSWKYITLLLISGQFLIPLAGLLIRAARRNPAFLAVISVWILVMHFFDLYWMVMPAFMVYDFYLSAIDLIIFLATGGILISSFIYVYFRRN